LSRHFIEVVEPLIAGGERYADLSVERIIKAGAVSRATFYVYFQDKGDLLRAMAQDVIQDLFHAGNSWWALPPEADKARLREALLPAIETYRAHHAIFGAVVEAAAYDARVRDAFNVLMDRTIADLTTHIRKEQRRGLASADLDAGRTAKWLIWMIERGLYEFVSPADEREASKLVDALTEIIWRTLYAGFRDASAG
jgi:AcrR family transcriptional regulator